METNVGPQFRPERREERKTAEWLQVTHTVISIMAPFSTVPLNPLFMFSHVLCSVSPRPARFEPVAFKPITVLFSCCPKQSMISPSSPTYTSTWWAFTHVTEWHIKRFLFMFSQSLHDDLAHLHGKGSPSRMRYSEQHGHASPLFLSVISPCSLSPGWGLSYVMVSALEV